MQTNRLKDKFRSNTPVIGMPVSTPDPFIVETAAGLGYDYLFIDMEHSPIDFCHLPQMLMAMKGSDTEPVVRVPWNDFVIVKRVLDLGVWNVIIPMIRNRAEAETAVAACKYPPKGVRGMGPGRAGLGVTDMVEFFEKADDEIGVIIQIEHIDALDHIDAILSTPGVDCTFCGPADMSASMGMISAVPHLDNPRIIEVFDKVLAACRRHDVVFGLATITTERSQAWLAKGAGLVLANSTLGIIKSEAARQLAETRDAIPR